MNLAKLFILFGIKVNTGQFKQAGDALKTLKAAAAVVGVAALARGIMHVAESAAESATHIVSMSKAMGMSIEQTQRWGYLAQQSGSNIKELSVGVNMFLRNLRTFSEGKGSKILAERFKELGLSRAEIKKALDSPDGVQDMLLKTSDGLHRMSDGMRKATNTTLFGVRAGRAMLVDLERGAPAIKELFAHFDKIGGVIGAKQVQDLRKLQNAINDIKAAWSGVTGQIIGLAAPAIIQFLEQMAGWIAENRELIGELLVGAVNALMAAFKAVMAVIDVVGGVIKDALGGDIGAQALIITLAGLLVSLLIPAIVAVGAAIWTAMAPLLPITFAIAAIVMLVLYLRKHWDEIGEAISRAFAVVMSVAGNFLEKIGHGFKIFGLLIWFSIRAVVRGIIGFLEWLAQGWVNSGKAIHAVINAIRDGFVRAWDAIARKASWLGDKIVEYFRRAWSTVRNLPGIHWMLDQLGVPGFEFHVKGDKTTGPPSGAEALSDFARWLTGAGSMAKIMTRSDTGNMLTNVPPAFAAQQAQQALTGTAAARTTEVSVGPTTINLYGVKDATEAKDNIADSIDGVHRHAAAALGGEVQ